MSSTDTNDERLLQPIADRLTDLASGLPAPVRPQVSALIARQGKYLRARLVLASARVDGTADAARLVRAGALVELLHLASLLHDDVVDRADTRRGGPAVHAVVGIDIAMLAGVACFALAGMEAADLGDAVAQITGRVTTAVTLGEVLDVQRAFDTGFSLNDYAELVERKTGELFRLACLLGAAEAGAGKKVVDALAEFGMELGVSYQILDDCRDLQANGDDKPSGTDHLLGLFGAPTLFALAADPRGELETLLLAPGFGAKDLPAVRSLVTARGGFEAAARLAAEHRLRALAALDGLRRPDACAGLVSVAGILSQVPS